MLIGRWVGLGLGTDGDAGQEFGGARPHGNEGLIGMRQEEVVLWMCSCLRCKEDFGAPRHKWPKSKFYIFANISESINNKP